MREASTAQARRAVFRRARRELAAWYTLTLAVILLAFSGVLYGVFAARVSSYRHEHEPAAERRVERETAAFAIGELRLYLLLGNATLLVLGAGGAYLLAGRTLQPILRAMERQDRFTSDASHELRTPLAAMRSAVDVALQRSRSPAAYREALAGVNEEVAGMTDLLEELLWIARGAPPQRPEPVELRALLADVLRRTAGPAAERGSTVQVETGGPVTAAVDPAALRRVLLNLVGNALRHTPGGTTVRLGVERDSRGVLLHVADNGPGIPEAERESVFLPFYRLSPAGEGGHGLGLALTRELVGAAGGQIRLIETPGGGATALVWLPQPHGAAAFEPAPAPEAQVGGGL